MENRYLPTPAEGAPEVQKQGGSRGTHLGFESLQTLLHKTFEEKSAKVDKNEEQELGGAHSSLSENGRAVAMIRETIPRTVAYLEPRMSIEGLHVLLLKSRKIREIRRFNIGVAFVEPSL